MHKSVLVSWLLLAFAFIANAQDENKILKRFELVVGPSQSRNTGSNIYEPKYGYSLGIGYDQPLHKIFSLNLRVLYEQKGSTSKLRSIVTEADGSITPLTDKYTTKLNYITFYLIPTFHLGPNKNIHIGIGPYYSFLQSLSLNIHRTRTYDGLFISVRTEHPKNYFNSNHDAGGTFQIGYSFNVGDNLGLTVQGFYNSGGVGLYNLNFGEQRNNDWGVLVIAKIR
jgi:hypothetical protein